MKNSLTFIASSFALFFISALGFSQGELAYPIVDTNEDTFYDAQTVISAPQVGEDFSSFPERIYFRSVSSSTSKNIKKFIKN